MGISGPVDGCASGTDLGYWAVRVHSPHLYLSPATKGHIAMLYTIALILLVLWLLGLVSSYTLGGFIHVLLVIAIVVVILRVISGRKVV
jgi:hypothetical protein